MKKKHNDNKEVERLIKLYDSFRMAEFMDQSIGCDDINVRAMRILCAHFKRFGRNFSIVKLFEPDELAGLERLANSGNCVAQANLGMFYLHGIGVEENDVKARELFEESAKQGYRRGISILGKELLFNVNGRGDERRGKKLLNKAVKKGCAVAMGNLGMFMFYVLHDLKEGDKFKDMILRAGDAGVEDAYIALCKFPHISNVEISRIVRRAWEHGYDIDDRLWSESFCYGSIYGRKELSYFLLSKLPTSRLKALAKRDPVAKSYLAYLYLDGKLGLPLNYNEAKKLFEQAAKRGVAAAQCLLGECYYRGHGCKVNMDKAFYWFSEAAKQNEFQAVGWLGNMYYNALGCKRNVPRAISYIKMAAELDNESAQYNIALMCLKLCEGLPYNPGKAVDILWKLACRGHHGSIARLGECYVNGIGVQKDVERGYGLLSVAAEFTGVGDLYHNVRVRQYTGYLKFYKAAVSYANENCVEPSILKMLSDYDRSIPIERRKKLEKGMKCE